MTGTLRMLSRLIGIAFALAVWQMHAEEGDAESRFAAESLRFRTALHFDPLLDAPLEGLVKLYRESERIDELIGLYRNHVAQYPEDAGAKTVLVRILRRTDRAGADELLAEAVPKHPEFAPLQYLQFRAYEERGDPRAVEVLSRAIDQETLASRRNAWLEELLDLSEGESARALGKAQLAKSLTTAGQDAPSLLSLARLAQRHRFWEESLAALKQAKTLTKDAETQVEIDLMQAIALGQSNQKAKADALLVNLLGQLAPDHWRRREILSLRLGALATAEERKGLLATLEAAARTAPDNETAQLDYAEALLAAEQRKEAAKQLLAAATRLPRSRLLEARALEVLEATGDLEGLATLLTNRLESEPDRLDLRFRLVKAEYALRRDAAAEQDFRTVVAGLDPEEVSERLLELQRYLRGIERSDAAMGYLEQYVRNHPARLDVARELAEVRLEVGAEESIGDLVRKLRPEEAEAGNVLDFAEFLAKAGLVQAARTLVEAKLAGEPRQFELGLVLIELLGKLGDAAAARERIRLVREMADTTVHYRQWLEASISAHRRLESLPAFLESELNRYQFEEGTWPEEKVEKFLILCDAGKRELLAGRIAEGLRKQLSQAGIEPGLRLRLRKVLIAVLKGDPTAVLEVESQLKLLAAEDPLHRSEHDLHLALIYYRNERHDLSRRLLSEVDFAEINNLSLLREAADALVEYGFLEKAGEALASVTTLEPSDLLSWELRLSVLAALGEETTLRTLLRTLRNGEKGVKLREQSLRAINEHLEASYWRSVIALMASARIAEVLPLVAALDEEALPERTHLWSEWTRVRVLSELGRQEEAREALTRLQKQAAERKLEVIAFPDGMELALTAVEHNWSDDPGEATTEDATALFLTENPAVRWAFELPEGLEVFRVEGTSNHTLVLDDHLGIHCLDAASGKMLWRGRFDEAGVLKRERASSLFVGPQDSGGTGFSESEAALAASLPPGLLISEDRLFLVRGRKAFAHAIGDGAILWSASLPEREVLSGSRASGHAAPGVRLARANGRIVLFDPESGDLLGIEETSGKQLWQTRLGGAKPGQSKLAALTTGLELAGDLGIAFGEEAVLFDAVSGHLVWRFREGEGGRFPVVLRPPREEEAAASDLGHTAAGGEETLARFAVSVPGMSEVAIPPKFFKTSAALIGPAVYWAETRQRLETPSSAAIGGGALWLMQDGAVRRFSTDLPLASRKWEAQGTFLGRVGDHLWFLDEGELLHVDVHRGRSLRRKLDGLGGDSDLRATLAGHQIVVRGRASVEVFNALTGEQLGRAALPTPLIEYLGAFLPADAPPSPAPCEWQGRLHRSGPGRPVRCLPVSDVIRHGTCLSIFGYRIVVCLEPAPAPGTSLPPAPPVQ